MNQSNHPLAIFCDVTRGQQCNSYRMFIFQKCSLAVLFKICKIFSHKYFYYTVHLNQFEDFSSVRYYYTDPVNKHECKQVSLLI